jgi:Fic family protein
VYLGSNELAEVGNYYRARMNGRAATKKNNAGASRLSRRLVELGEYARREGISPQDVRKCAEIGILQLRSHKGKTFVVDMPVCSLENTDQIDTEVAELLGFTRPPNHIASQQQTVSASIKPITAKQTSEDISSVKNPGAKPFQGIRRLFSKTHKSSLNKQDNKAVSQSSARPCPSIQPGSISQLVQEMLRRAEQIKEQDLAATARTQTAQPITDVPQPSQKQTCQMTQELLTTMNRQLDQLERACPKPAEKSVSPPYNRTVKQ